MMKLCEKCISYLTDDCDGNLDEYYPMCFEDYNNPYSGINYDLPLDRELYNNFMEVKNV